MFRRLWRISAPVVAIALFGLLVPARADSLSLAQLLVQGTTIQSGDKLFSNFTYNNHGFTDPGTDHITVATIGNGSVNNYYGIEISGGFSDSADGVTSDWTLGYDVTVMDPSYVITDAHMFSNVDASGGSGHGTITETFTPSDVKITSFDVTPNPPGTYQPHDDTTFGLPGYTMLHITKDIQLDALSGVVTLSIVDQTFSQTLVPLPNTANMGLALLGCLGGLGAIRRLKLKRECELV